MASIIASIFLLIYVWVFLGVACGLASGMDLAGSVAPFILRGVSLLGVDSVHCPTERRLEAWGAWRLDLDRLKLASMTETIPLAEVFYAGARTSRARPGGGW